MRQSISFLILSSIIVLSSCNSSLIVKRKYRSGYNVQLFASKPEKLIKTQLRTNCGNTAPIKFKYALKLSKISNHKISSTIEKPARVEKLSKTSANKYRAVNNIQNELKHNQQLPEDEQSAEDDKEFFEKSGWIKILTALGLILVVLVVIGYLVDLSFVMNLN